MENKNKLEKKSHEEKLIEKELDLKLKKQVDSIKKIFDSYNKTKKFQKKITKDNFFMGGNYLWQNKAVHKFIQKFMEF